MNNSPNFTKISVISLKRIFGSKISNLKIVSFQPPTALVMLMLYYFCAETWFAILFTVIVEIVNQDVKAISIALFLFIMNNIGGNLPVIVSPIEDAIGYRQAIYLVWPGAQALSAVLFFIASIPLKMRNGA